MVFFNKKDWYIIHAATIIVLFWVALWNLTEEVIDNIEERYNITKWKIYLGLLLVVLVIISVDPHLFEKL